MLRIYNVGPLFTEGEKKQRQYEGRKISQLLETNAVKYELSNPIDMPTSNQLDVTSKEIYQADYDRLDQADVVFFDLSNEDSGSCVALGIIMEKKMQGKDIKVYPVFHDIRLTRNGQSGLESSCGFNSMVVGILKGNNIPIYHSFEEAFNQFASDYQLTMDLHLEEIQTVPLVESYRCFSSFEADENGFHNEAYGMNLDEFQHFVQECYQESKSVGLPDWKVPQTVYLLMKGNTAIGIFKVRHYLNEALRNGAGHIGYGICKEYRRQGYAKKGLLMAMKKLSTFMLEDEIYMSCNKDNIASKKTQLACGCYVHHEDEKEYYTRCKKL
ncbi:MAG: GNAT family N-acetyltransferase [Erysipelotrichaceae bacterium]|nr:GNAT family N-acetyltransferase [Erysipelotrichaceae bacterium]